MTSADPESDRFLVTGAAGFIGFHVARALLGSGYKVLGLDSLNDYYDVRLKQSRLAQIGGTDGFSFEKTDLSDASATQSVFEKYKPHRVIHLAAQPGVRYSLENPSAYISANISGFLNVLEACRATRPEHLIYASSSSVYGINARPPYSVSDKSDHPVSLYAASKKSNELMAHSYSHLFDLPATGLRFFTVYGPWGRPDMAVYSFTEAISEGRPIRLFNNGDLRRDFTYVDDITEGVFRVATGSPPQSGAADTGGPTTAPWRIYNIGNNTPVAVPELIALLEKRIGKKAIIQKTAMQPGDVYETCADIDPIMRDYGFQPKTDLSAGLSEFVAWYNNYISGQSHT